MSIKFRPIGDKILVKRIAAEEVTKGGIVLPDTAKEKPQEGKIVALGEGRLLENGKRHPFQVKKEDRVIFSSYAGSEIKMEGDEYLVISEEEILGVVE